MARPRKYENKTVVRKYFSKKLNQVITKTYEYSRDVYATGKNTTRKYVNKLQSKAGKQFKSFENYYNKLSTLADKAALQNISRIYEKQHKVLTVARAEYEISKNKIISALDNTGYSLDEIASQIGTSANNLTNIENWDGSIYTDPNTGKKYQYVWTYTGTVLNELN